MTMETNIKTPPTLTSSIAMAWEMPISPDYPAAIGQWLIESRAFHPVWSRWVLNVIHLRDVEGWPPAHKTFASATHELSIQSLNPEYYHEHETLPLVRPKAWRYLTPPDLVEQFQVKSDEEARIIFKPLRARHPRRQSEPRRRFSHDMEATLTGHRSALSRGEARARMIHKECTRTLRLTCDAKGCIEVVTTSKVSDYFDPDWPIGWVKSETVIERPKTSFSFGEPVVTSERCDVVKVYCPTCAAKAAAALSRKPSEKP